MGRGRLSRHELITRLTRSIVSVGLVVALALPPSSALAAPKTPTETPAASVSSESVLPADTSPVAPAPAATTTPNVAPAPTDPPTPTNTPPPSQTATRTAAATSTDIPTDGSSRSVISGTVVLDENLDGTLNRGDRAVTDLVVRIQGPGVKTDTVTNGNGQFVFDELPAGAYTISLALPYGLVPTTTSSRTVVVNGRSSARSDFFVARLNQVTPTSTVTSTPSPTGTSTATPTHTPRPSPTATATPTVLPDDPSATPSTTARPLITSLQGLRYVPGRTSPSTIQAVKTDDALWLGVPFTTQIDGSTYAEVNCGPASVAMVLAAFGVRTTPSYLRDYVNYLSGVFSPDQGTSLVHLDRVVREAGLDVWNLYGGGGFQSWSTRLLRDQIEAGHPVVTLVKYRALPGHGGSYAEFDHYIVITGLSGQDFIYNDAAFVGDRGFGLLISPEDLQRAWDYSTLPRHGMAVGLGEGMVPRQIQLPFNPVALPVTTREPVTAAGPADQAPEPLPDERAEQSAADDTATTAMSDEDTALLSAFSSLTLTRVTVAEASELTVQPIAMVAAPAPLVDAAALSPPSIPAALDAAVSAPEPPAAPEGATLIDPWSFPDPLAWLALVLSIVIFRVTRRKLRS